MEQQRIHIIGMPFHAESLRLTTPTVVQNGNSHFTRILFDDVPLYFQTPRCETKQGIVTTTTKKTYYDLILDSNSETSHSPREFTAFVEWIQALEDAAVKLLCSNGKMWFRDPLSEDDIRALFTSPLKPLKGGKQLSLRVNLTTSLTRANQYTCTVFDESEKLVHLSYVSPEHQIISIVEVLGVRFTSSSFQLDLAAKQVAVVATQPLFQTCVIKKGIVESYPQLASSPVPSAPVSNKNVFISTVSANDLKPVSDNDITRAVDLSADNAIKIHDPLKVYYALYKAALKRANAAKRESIQAFLDAKHIKNKYNLDVYEHECRDDGEGEGEGEGEGDSESDSDNDSNGDGESNSLDGGVPGSEEPGSDSDSGSGSGSGSGSDSDSDSGSITKGKPPIKIMEGQNISILVEEVKK